MALEVTRPPRIVRLAPTAHRKMEQFREISGKRFGEWALYPWQDFAITTDGAGSGIAEWFAGMGTAGLATTRIRTSAEMKELYGTDDGSGSYSMMKSYFDSSRGKTSRKRKKLLDMQDS